MGNCLGLKCKFRSIELIRTTCKRSNLKFRSEIKGFRVRGVNKRGGNGEYGGWRVRSGWEWAELGSSKVGGVRDGFS